MGAAPRPRASPDGRPASLRLPFTSSRGRSGGGKSRQRMITPRVTRLDREHRLEMALDAMHAAIRATKREADGDAATPASNASALPDSVDVEEVTCLIPGARLHQLFTAVNTPMGASDPMAQVGASFRAALNRLYPATVDMALLTDASSSHKIENQVQRARGSSSPGLDSFGYDIFRSSRPSFCLLCYSVRALLAVQACSAELEGLRGAPASHEGCSARPIELAADLPAAGHIQAIRRCLVASLHALARRQRPPR
uniref:Uncharacterized protein n=1 Tax=Peronospora matthiolae TaxID=2874970 RepID=A0AAV1TA56_9STRA